MAQTTRNIEGTFDLRPEHLSTKGQERFHGKKKKHKKKATQISVLPMVEILMHVKSKISSYERALKIG